MHLENSSGITAAVVYNQYIPPTSIDLHVVASPDGRRWLTRPFLVAVFRYPFEQLGVRRVTARIGANNHRARRFLEHLGFTHEGTIRQGWEPNIDMEIFGMLRDECKFLGDRYNGKAIRARAA